MARRLLDRKEKLLNETRGRGRSEAWTLGKGARALIGFVLTVLLVATQAQFVAGATTPQAEGEEVSASQSAEAIAAEASVSDVVTAEEPAAEPSVAEEPTAEEPPAPEPAPEPTEAPPADDGGGTSDEGGSDGDGTEPGADEGTDLGDSTGGSHGAPISDDGGKAGSRRLSRVRAEGVRPLNHIPDTAGPPSGNGVQPTVVPDNPSCRLLAPSGTTWSELRVNAPADGTFSGGALTVTLDVTETDDGPVFAWTSNIGLDAVFVKGGSNGNLYLYDEATSDTSLHSPVNPHNNKFYGLSHISFCYDVEEDQPDVSVSKSANFEGEELPPGGSLTYTITVTNEGTGTAEGVTLTDDLDDNLENVSALPSQGICDVGADNTLSCDLGDIDEGESATVTIDATVAEDFCGELTNQATVDAENDTNPGNNTSETITVTVVCQPDVAVEKSKSIEGNPLPGDTFDFTITVTNVGTGTVEDVVLTDTIEAGLAFVEVEPGEPTCGFEEGDQTVTCDLGDIEEGDSVTVTITVSVAEDFCGAIANTAKVTSSNDTNSKKDSDTIKFEAECEPDVSVSKSAEVDGDEVDEVPSGSSFTYVITVTNEGVGTAEGVTLEDDLDDALENVTATPSQGTCLPVGSGNTLSCNLGDIEQGQSATVTIEVDVPADFCGTLVNQATVDAENDTVEENNQSDRVTVDVPCGPDIDVRKTNDADTDSSFSDEEEALHEGDPVTFKVVITNTGNVAIQLDSLLDEYEGIAITPDCLTAEGDNVLGMTLAPGDSVICFFTVDDYAPEPNGAIVDVVTVEGHDVQNPEVTVSDFDDSTVTTPQVLPEPPIRPEPPPPGPPPGKVLAVTGAELALMGLVALALVLAGIALSYLGRREDETGT